jgi:putative ABC transport system permease protein
MNMKLKKAIADLRNQMGRTALVIVALSLGIWGMSTIFVSYIILNNDLNANYLLTDPAHLILESDQFDDSSIELLKQLPSVMAVERRSYSIQRIEVTKDQWIPLWLYGVDDFNNTQVAHTFPEAGAIEPDNNTLLFERNGRLVSDLAIGKSARIRVGTRIMQVPVSGIVFDPAQAPSTQDAFVYGYVNQQTFENITGETSGNRILLRLNNVTSKSDVQKLVVTIENKLNREGIHLSDIRIPNFEKHPHQWQLNTILMMVFSVGLLMFIISAVVVSQLVKALISQQIRQIGILKAIGATATDILKIYFAMLFIVGVFSALLAIPAAIATGTAFSGFVATVLNFNILTTSLPHWVVLTLIGVSLSMPLIFTAFSIRKASKTQVREALTDYGITQNVSTLKFELDFLPHAMKLAIRNSRRKSSRLVATVFSMILGVAIFSSGFNVRQSLIELLDGFEQSLGYDVQLVLSDPVSRENAIAPFLALENIKEFEVWSGGQGAIQSKILASSSGVGIVALPYDTKMQSFKMIDGSWLSSNDRLQVVLNQKALALYENPTVGDLISVGISGKTNNAVLVGISEQFDLPKMYLDLTMFRKLFNSDNTFNTLLVQAIDDGYDSVIELKKNIEREIVNSNLSVTYVVSQAERVKVIYDHLIIILSCIIFLSLMVLIVSAIGMASSTGINILERRREIGIMRAIGATPKAIINIFVSEGLIISAISCVLGLILAWPLSQWASSIFGVLLLGNGGKLTYAFSTEGFVITLACTTLFSWLASRIPARNAIKIPTQQALSYE